LKIVSPASSPFNVLVPSTPFRSLTPARMGAGWVTFSVARVVRVSFEGTVDVEINGNACLVTPT
jgi:hypothetical protein